MTQDQAEILAFKAIEWLAMHDTYMTRFMALSGLSPGDIMGRSDDKDMLAGIINFLLSDETMLLAFCDDHALDPALPAQAQHRLAGETNSDWT